MLAHQLEKMYAFSNGVACLMGSFAVGATGAVGVHKGHHGVTITRTAAGTYNLALQDGMPDLIAGFAGVEDNDTTLVGEFAKLAAITPGTKATAALILCATYAAPTTKADPTSGQFVHYCIFFRVTEDADF